MIVKIDEFSRMGANMSKCFVMNRPLLEAEKYAFRIGAIEEDDRGLLEISQGAVSEMAQIMKWSPPEKVAKLHEQHNKTVCDLRAQVEELQELVSSQEDPGVVVRRLARDLDLAEATKSDAVRQFQEAEAELKELRMFLAEAEQRIAELEAASE